MATKKYSKKYGKNPRNVHFNQPEDKRFMQWTRTGKPPGGSFRPKQK